MGEAIANGTAGDLYIKLHVKRHPKFRKEGNDIVTDLHVKLTDAILGAEYDVDTLDGRLKVKIPEGAAWGEILRVRGRGVPNGNRRRGDLLIKLAIQMPQNLSRDLKKHLQELRTLGL
jgi:molecular chaperone DnaJ